MPQNLLGIGNLTNKLSRILFTHIKHSLPEITKEIKDKMKETEDDLKDIGLPVGPRVKIRNWIESRKAKTTEDAA